MNLYEKLWKTAENWEPKPIEPFVMDTADELFEKFMRAAKARAAGGCYTINFHWDYHHSTDQAKWEAMREIREQVVQRLREGGLSDAQGFPAEFPKPVFNDWAQEWSPQTGRHYIKASWFPPKKGGT